MRRLSNRHLGMAVAISFVAAVVFFGMAPSGGCRDPSPLEGPCDTAGKLVVLAGVMSLLILVALLLVGAARLVSTRR